MTATPDIVNDGTSVFIWFGIPDAGRPYVLMVAVQNGDHPGIVHRPLVYLNREQADENGRPLAEAAAAELGVNVELREYAGPSVLDGIEVVGP